MENLKFYRFGSKDSIDEDYLIEHLEATGTEIDVNLIPALKSQYPEMQNWDINIIKVIEGKIVFSIPSKGNPDAVHNSLLRTYFLHEQKFPCPIQYPVKRNINKAIDKCLDHVLTFYKNTDSYFYKNIARPALKSKNFKIKVDTLKQIDFDELKLSTNSNDKLKSLKNITFHISQTLALINNKEIYTKDELITEFPELKDIIYRSEINSYSEINKKLKKLHKLLEIHNYDVA